MSCRWSANLFRRNPSTISKMNICGWASLTALITSGHRFRWSSAPVSLPPLDHGWHGGPPVIMLTPRHGVKSMSLISELMILSNPLRRRVLTHSASLSMSPRMSMSSRLSANAIPPHPVNRSSAVNFLNLLFAWVLSSFVSIGALCVPTSPPPSRVDKGRGGRGATVVALSGGVTGDTASLFILGELASAELSIFSLVSLSATVAALSGGVAGDTASLFILGEPASTELSIFSLVSSSEAQL